MGSVTAYNANSRFISSCASLISSTSTGMSSVSFQGRFRFIVSSAAWSPFYGVIQLKVVHTTSFFMGSLCALFIRCNACISSSNCGVVGVTLSSDEGGEEYHTRSSFYRLYGEKMRSKRECGNTSVFGRGWRGGVDEGIARKHSKTRGRRRDLLESSSPSFLRTTGCFVVEQ